MTDLSNCRTTSFVGMKTIDFVMTCNTSLHGTAMTRDSGFKYNIQNSK